MRSWAYNRFGVLMGASWRASALRWPRLREDIVPMITPFPSQGYFCATALADIQDAQRHGNPHIRLLGVILSGVDKRTRLASTLNEYVEQIFAPDAAVLPSLRRPSVVQRLCHKHRN